MKILHIINDKPSRLTDEMIAFHSGEHKVKVINLSKKAPSYGDIIDDIFSHDLVISWNGEE